MKRRLVIVLAAALSALGGSVAAPASAAPANQALGGPAGNLFADLAPGGHAGYSSGTVIHADAVQTADSRVANLDVAFSGASFSSAPLAQVTNEMSRVVSPLLNKAGSAFGRGSGLEASVTSPPSSDSQVVLSDKVEALAPPSTGLLSKETTADLSPALAAGLLRGEAQSLAGAACTTGIDLSHGLGFAADVAVAKTGEAASLLATQAAGPLRSTVQSRSATRLVDQSGEKAKDGIARFGLQSETRQTIAPITFLAGTDQQFTLELLGEWVLQATADGREGKVFYGPAKTSPETPILRLLDKAGAVTQQIKFQDFFGQEGLVVPIPDVAKIVLGEDPRAIAGDETSKPEATPTLAAAAVDVARVQLLNQPPGHVADVRVGHMESAVTVPDGGITCGIGIVKKAIPTTVRPGGNFKWAITVTNPNDCTLKQVKVVDVITATTGVVWTTTGATPKADTLADDQVIWNDIGPIAPGASEEQTIDVFVKPESLGGRFLDTATVTAVCGPAPAEGDATAGAGAGGAPVAGGAVATEGVSQALSASASIELPLVIAVAGAVELPAVLPRTGSRLPLAPALAMSGLGLALIATGKLRRR